jgi:hypothetical protein
MAGWSIRVAPGRRAVVALEPARRVEHAGQMQPMHFYVPKGTRELQYYWHGRPHRVHGPDGAVLKEVTTSGAFVKVPVPEGADGKTHFSQMTFGTLCSSTRPTTWRHRRPPCWSPGNWRSATGCDRRVGRTEDQRFDQPPR